ncbi:hypothetical protein Patl1_05181 [Pistacia atlantica]|uniref:Uncharacterized protein n=1 Tax=Pistacia atlantica TaxID=434234 RepID=A0ACC1BUY5_9ROSI|nr:hypothetical protein Patl1_05181 [Pistacia atlantica]
MTPLQKPSKSQVSFIGIHGCLIYIEIFQRIKS